MNLFLNCLLGIALTCFTLDLSHLLYHLFDEPVLWELGKVPSKLLIKSLAVLLSLALVLRRLRLKSVVFVFLLMLYGAPTGFASSRACQEAGHLKGKSGVSRDASENLLGKVKVKPPHGSFPQDMDKITWWGEFKPFELWDNPEFQAVWINPAGDEVSTQTFRGKKCRLAKTTLRGEDQERGQFQGGMWKVVVSCDEEVLDQQSFAVLPESNAQSHRDGAQNKGSMIWAEDMIGKAE